MDRALRAQLTGARSTALWQKTPDHYKVMGLERSCTEEEVRGVGLCGQG